MQATMGFWRTCGHRSLSPCTLAIQVSMETSALILLNIIVLGVVAVLQLSLKAYAGEKGKNLKALNL